MQKGPATAQRAPVVRVLPLDGLGSRLVLGDRVRVPAGGRASRRIENRIAGSDTNPYLAIAASLLCGYLGMVEGGKPSEPVTGSAYGLTTNCLPQHIHASLETLEECDTLKDLLGDAFVTTFLDVKRAEIEARSNVLSSWDTKYLLTNV